MDDADLLASFMAYLQPHRIDGAPEALLTLCGTRDVGGWRRRHVLRPTAERIDIRIADEEEALWQGLHCGVRVTFGGPMRIELVLPPKFRSIEAMRSYLDRRDKSFFLYAFRLRAILFTICDMLLVDRIDFTLAVRARFGTIPGSLWFRVSPEDGCGEPAVLTTSRDAGPTNIVIPDCSARASRNAACLRHRFRWRSSAATKSRCTSTAMRVPGASSRNSASPAACCV